MQTDETVSPTGTNKTTVPASDGRAVRDPYSEAVSNL